MVYGCVQAAAWGSKRSSTSSTARPRGWRPRAPQVLGALPGEGFAAELQRSTVETNTAVCRSLDELRHALLQRRQRVISAAGELGLGVVAAGTALVSEGADNSAWFEHRLLSEEAGLLLANPGDVDVRGGRVVVGGQPVDVLYLRLGGELVDLAGTGGRPLGAQIVELACRRQVVVVNAPGNGIADDKAVYCYVPELIAYYLGERPLLAQVPTYRCADPSECTAVLDRLGELVTKPVGGYGGSGVVIGPDVTAEQIEGRRREILADPGNWVAQETVALSTVPTLVDGRLEPRHVDLRAFVYPTGPEAGQAELADLALTRVAPAGSRLVNSSRGGGAKDTWILAGRDGADPAP